MKADLAFVMHKNTSKLCSACSASFFFFFFPAETLAVSLSVGAHASHHPPRKNISETSSRAECIQKSIIQYAAHCISLLGELITSNVPLQDLMQTQSLTQLDFVPTVTEKILPEGSQRLAEKNHFRFLTKG